MTKGCGIKIEQYVFRPRTQLKKKFTIAKQARNYFFPQKTISTFFNGDEVQGVDEHKHLGIITDPKLNFAAHLKE